jgi:hypothetical protein
MLFRYALFKYPLKQPYVKEMAIHLEDGRLLRGVLAAKPKDKARDLVIFRCGIFCDSKANSTLANALMNVFEENPVHVLFLNSSTGLEFAKDNGASYIGGFDEGYQNLEVADYVYRRQAALGIKIRRIHVLGMSLGGASVLFSSLFAEAQAFPSLPLDTFAAFCPLVDARGQFDEVLGHTNLASLLFRYRTGKVLKQAMPFMAALQKILGTGLSGKEAKSLDRALNISAGFYEHNWERMGFGAYIAKPSRVDRNSLLDSCTLLNYDNQYSPNTFVLHAENDMLVPWKENSAKLRRTQPSQLGVLSTRWGNHCAFTQALDWGVLTHYVSALVNEPKDLPRSRHQLPPSVARYLAKPIWNTQVRSHYQWSVDSGKSFARLKVWTFKGFGQGCVDQKPTYSQKENPYECHTEATVKVTLSELAYLGFPGVAPDESSASRMERYLNGRTRFLTRSGKLAVGTKEDAEWLEAQGKFDARYGVL